MSKYILKWSTNIVLNPIFKDCVLKKYSEGLVRERWEFSGALIFNSQEAIDLKAYLDLYEEIVFYLYKSDNTLLTVLRAQSSKYNYSENQNILEIYVENDTINYNNQWSFESVDIYKDLSETPFNWLYSEGGESVRIEGLESQTKLIEYSSNSITPVAAKNRYTYFQTVEVITGLWRHSYVKSIAKFKPSGSYAQNAFALTFEDDYSTEGQEVEDTFWICYKDYFSCSVFYAFTDLYANLNRGVPNWNMMTNFNYTYNPEYQVLIVHKLDYDPNLQNYYFYNYYLQNYTINNIFPYSRILWFDAADVKRFFSDVRTAQNMITPKEIIDIQKAVFDLEYMFIGVQEEQGYYGRYTMLIHPSETDTFGTEDLTNWKDGNWTENYNKLSKNSERKIIIQEYNQKQSPQWNKEFFFVRSNPKVEKSLFDRLIFDVKDLIENPDDYPDDGIVLIATQYTDIGFSGYNSQQYSNDFPFNRANSYMNPSILRKLHKTYNHYKNEQAFITIDVVEGAYSDSFQFTAKKDKQLDEIFAPVDFDEIDINMNIITDLGTCRLDKIEIPLDGSFSKLTLFKE